MGNNRIYRDSIGKCDYSNPYDVRMQSHPSIVRQRAENYLDGKDSLASKHWILEKEIFLKLQAADITTSGALMVLGKIGKFAFLTLVLPPYIFCYGIPKWLITEAFPRFYEIMGRIVKGISDRVSEVAHGAINALKTLGGKITSPILLYIETRIEKAREFFNAVKETFLYVVGYPYRLLQRTFIQPIVKMVNDMSEAFQTVAKGFQKVAEKLQQFQSAVKSFFVYLPQNIQKQFEKIFNKINTNFDKALEPYQPVITWFKEKIENANQFLKQTAEFVFEKAVQLPKEKIVQFAQAVKDKGALLFEAVAAPIRDWADPKVEALREGFENVKGGLNRVKDKCKEKVKEIAREIWDDAKERLDTIAKFSEKIITHTWAAMLNHMPQPVISLFTAGGSLIKRAVDLKASKRVASVILQKIGEKFNSNMERAFKWIQKGKNVVKKALQKSFEKLKKVPLKTYALLKKIFLVLITALKGTFLIFQLLLAWVLALIHYGIVQTQIASRQLFALRRFE